MSTQIYATAYRTTKVDLYLTLDSTTIEEINQHIAKRLKYLNLESASKGILSEGQLLYILRHTEEKTSDIFSYIAYDVIREYLINESIKRNWRDTDLVLQDRITVQFTEKIK